MNLYKYHQTYSESSKIHAKNVITYGSSVFMGYPTYLPEQINRVGFIVSHAHGLILDIGADSGYILSACGGGIGIDISYDRLKAAKHWNHGLPLFQAFAEYLPFKDNIFDTVIVAELLEHVIDTELVLREAYRVLKHQSGRLIVTVPDEIHGKSHMNPEHLRMFTEDELKTILVAYFNIDTWSYIEGDYPTYCVCCTKK